MADAVVHSDARDMPELGKCAARHGADKERAEQAGTACHCDRFDVRSLDLRLLQRLPNDGDHALHLFARRFFGDDTCERGEERLRAGDDVAEYGAAVFHDGGGRLIARCFDAKEDHEVESIQVWVRIGDIPFMFLHRYPFPMFSLFPSRTIALSVFGFAIHWYGIMYVLAFLTAIWLLPRLGKMRKLNLSYDQWLSLVSWIIVGVLVGGRLGFVLLYNPSYYFSHPREIFFVWQGGMASHGGFVAVILVLFLWVRKERVNFLSLGDIVTVPAAIGLALGRIGNLINQELYGTVTSLPWGISIPGVAGLRHPTQAYECLWDLATAVICFFLLKYFHTRNGRIGVIFLMLYAVGRFLLEYFREQQYSLFTIGTVALTRGQLYTIPLFLFALVVWFLAPKRKVSS